MPKLLLSDCRTIASIEDFQYGEFYLNFGLRKVKNDILLNFIKIELLHREKITTSCRERTNLEEVITLPLNSWFIINLLVSKIINSFNAASSFS